MFKTAVYLILMSLIFKYDIAVKVGWVFFTSKRGSVSIYCDCKLKQGQLQSGSCSCPRLKLHFIFSYFLPEKKYKRHTVLR